MLEELLEGWRRGARGPLPHLTPLQLLAALLTISREGPVGRRALAQSIMINDGVARGLLERLAEQGLVSVSDSGAQLSPRGRGRLEALLGSLSVGKITKIDQTGLVPGKTTVAINLLNQYRPGITGIPQRDEAVRAGAEGSILMAMKQGRLVIPPDNRDVANISPQDNLHIRRTLNPAENDLVVLGFAGDERRALSGALAAVLSLVPSKKAL